MLLNWIRRRLANRQRALFAYWDGTRLRRIDPMVAYRGLAGHKTFNWQSDPAMVDFIDSDFDAGSEAFEKCLGAVRDVFGVAPWSEQGGLTESETFGLLIQFNQYLDAVKKNGSGSLMSANATGSPGLGASDTSSRSDSGSTSAAPNSAEPPPPAAPSSPPCPTPS